MDSLIRGSLFLAILLATSVPMRAHSQQAGVLSYHGNPERSGHFVIQGLTWERARSLHLDPDFHARVSGHVYAQPLYWRQAGSGPGMLLVATEDNTVHALDATTGAEIWRRSVGKPVTRSSLGCGNIDPLGITGTPVIDPSTGTIYLDAAVAEASGPRHRVFALALQDGAPLPRWPVDVTEALRSSGKKFNARDQNQRGALTILDGTVYVPFGGHYGDCGDYHGWVVGIATANPRKVTSWSTDARGGGIWSSQLATRSAPRPGAAARQWFGWHLTCTDRPTSGTSSLRQTGVRLMRAMPISAAPTRSHCASRHTTACRVSSWPSAKMDAPMFSIITISAESAAAWWHKQYPRRRSAPRRRATRSAAMPMWHFRVPARAVHRRRNTTNSPS
jgi:hypothetical protein